jgi:hypothetical protein
MKPVVRPPRPSEETLTELVTRDVALPNGRVLRLTMSRWHWEMIEFIDIWNEYYGREPGGIIYQFYKACPNIPDSRFAKAAMSLLRDDYNEWTAGLPPGEDPVFDDPRT